MDKTRKTNMAPDEEAIRVYYTQKLKKIVGRHYSWIKLKTFINNGEKKDQRTPGERLRWVVGALFLLPTEEFTSHYIYLWTNLQQHYSRELSIWCAERKTLVKIDKTDIYVDTLFGWADVELIIGYTLFDYVRDMEQIWQPRYGSHYFRQNLQEMEEDRREGGELTSFSEFKARKKKDI